MAWHYTSCRTKSRYCMNRMKKKGQNKRRRGVYPISVSLCPLTAPLPPHLTHPLTQILRFQPHLLHLRYGYGRDRGRDDGDERRHHFWSGFARWRSPITSPNFARHLPRRSPPRSLARLDRRCSPWSRCGKVNKGSGAGDGDTSLRVAQVFNQHTWKRVSQRIPLKQHGKRYIS